MPKLTTDIPNNLRPFQFHGVELEETGSGEAVGDCPFCSREGKLYVNLETSKWDCKRCKASGNSLTFLRQLWDLSDKSTTDYSELATDRKFLTSEALTFWGAAKSVSTGHWILPGFSPEGKLVQLYRRIKIKDNSNRWNWKLLPTPGLSKDGDRHGMFGIQLFDPNKETVYLCESPWDAMALWELLRCTRREHLGDHNLVLTGNESASLLAGVNVISTPGANIFYKTWAPLFADKQVVFISQNDHPLKNPKTGTLSPPVSYAEVQRVSELLSSGDSPPTSIKYYWWGKEGYNPDLKHGYDIRDILSSGETAGGRLPKLDSVLKNFRPIPEDWIKGRTVGAVRNGGLEIELLPCKDWSTLINSWRKAMKWSEGLDRALSVMLASILSTPALGDQLWVKIMGPPSCGKSTLCEALAVAKKYIHSKSTIRGFHSGYKSDKDGTEDHSLILQVTGKTLITKDGDTLLQSPGLPQILSEARDLYDCVSRAHYRHGMSRDYENVRMTWILCGTSSLRQLDDSELGARFLDCKIMDAMEKDDEREIGYRVANRAFQNVAIISNGKPESRKSPELTFATQLTGGYIEYLRDNVEKLLAAVSVSEEYMELCIYLGEFVSFARARPSKKQDEVVERELSARLVEQFCRLAACLAAVIGRPKIDEEVMRRVRRVAKDTAQGKTLSIFQRLYQTGEEGEGSDVLGAFLGEEEDKMKPVLKFLCKIGAIESFKKTFGPGLQGRTRYRLTERLKHLYEEVYNDA